MVTLPNNNKTEINESPLALNELNEKSVTPDLKPKKNTLGVSMT